MVRVYISGQIQKTACRSAEETARQLAALGFNPFLPRVREEDCCWADSAESDCQLELDFEWLSLCQALYLMPGWQASIRAWAEYEQAERLGIPVAMSIDDLKALYQPQDAFQQALVVDRQPQVICD